MRQHQIKICSAVIQYCMFCRVLSLIARRPISPGNVPITGIDYYMKFRDNAHH